MSKTGWAVAITASAAVIGFFVGAGLNDAFGGATVFALIAGVGCIVNAIDDRREDASEDKEPEA